MSNTIERHNRAAHRMAYSNSSPALFINDVAAHRATRLFMNTADSGTTCTISRCSVRGEVQGYRVRIQYPDGIVRYMTDRDFNMMHGVLG